MVRYYGRARQRIGSVNTNQPGLKQAGCPGTVGKQGLIIQHLGKRVNCNLKTCGLPMSGLRCRYGVADAIGRDKTFMDIQNSNNPAIKNYCKQVVGGQNGVYCQWPQPRNRQNAGGVGNIWTSRRNHCEKTCSLGWKEAYMQNHRSAPATYELAWWWPLKDYGHWDQATKTFFVTGDARVGPGAVITIPAKNILLIEPQAGAARPPHFGNEGAIINNGTIRLRGSGMSSRGLFRVDGTITNNNGGTINNQGGLFVNAGKITNKGKITTGAVPDSYGTIKNVVGGIINNNGEIDIGSIGGAGGDIQNEGTINNRGTINNYGSLVNNPNRLTTLSGVINNNGGAINIWDEALVGNGGTITNNNRGIITNQGGAINNSAPGDAVAGAFSNTGTITCTDGATWYGLCPTPPGNNNCSCITPP